MSEGGAIGIPSRGGRGAWGARLAVAVMLLFVAACATVSESTAGRSFVELPAWRFVRGDPDGAAALEFVEEDWAQVTLPHTFNAADGEDGGGYYRGPGWYRTNLPISDINHRHFLEFDGAALVTNVWVNGRAVGEHRGGYARFRIDVTEALRRGDNLIAVRVDNARAPDVAPLGGDFTVFGGLYRGVRLISTPETHIDLLDHGGPGVYAEFAELSPDQARGNLIVRVRNSGAADLEAHVRVRVMEAGRSVASAEAAASVESGEVAPIVLPVAIASPRLWNGRADPHLYRVVAEVVTPRGVDRVEIPLGLRDVRFDPAQGLLLNGRRAPMYGVNYFHSGRPGRGLAVGDAEIDEDMEILSELGLNALRFVHFQHPQRAYDRADELGLMVWTEIPLNAAIDADPAFEQNIRDQMLELIRQNQHHPSVVIWGLGNEIYASNADVHRVLGAVQATAREADPSRPTAYAHCCFADDDPNAGASDAIGFNRYFGWYDGEFARMGAWADEHYAASGRSFAVSEYGAGASIRHQEDPPLRPAPAGPWHPEQYQALYHEENWRQLRERGDFLWGRFVWVGFDLASDGRSEGDRPGINDKGLVTYDRSVRKDAYYFYQAQWADALMVHIASRRLRVRATPEVEVRVYSNADAVTLEVNGTDVGERTPQGGVAVWRGVRLQSGANRIEARGRRGDERVADSVEWGLEAQ